MGVNVTNWARNVRFAARELVSPPSVEALQETVAAARRVRALGSGHSFNTIADTPGTLVRLDALPRIVEADPDARTARVSAGMTFADVSAELRPYGLALPNLPSTPHFTLAGAYATGTHGSGDANRTLAAAVSRAELVTADGELVTVGRDDASFDGIVTSLGALGVLTAVTLDLRPAFEVAQEVYEGLPWEALVERFGDVFGAAFSVSAFTTDWSGEPRLWVKRRTGDPAPDLTWTGARPADAPHHPIPGMPVANATAQLGEPGPWDERLPHFRSGFMPSVGEELQSEYFVARRDAGAAITALRGLASSIAPVLQVSEIRTVAADDCWLSPSHGRDSTVFHFTWLPDTEAVLPVLAAMEEALAPFDARPHWGKLSSTAPEALSASYAHWGDFRALLDRYDPRGKFRNALIDRWFPQEG